MKLELILNTLSPPDFADHLARYSHPLTPIQIDLSVYVFGEGALERDGGKVTRIR